MNLPKSIDAVIALLGIQLSGNIYVPLDVETPRKEKILERLGSDRVLEHITGEFRLGGKIFAYAHDADMENSVLEKLSARKPWTFDKYIGWDFLSAYVTLQYFAMIHIFVYTVPQATLADNIRIFLTGLGY